MPKGRVLSKDEQEQILKLHDAGASGREIAKKIQRSKTVVLNYLRNPSQYAQVKRAGRKRLLSAEEEQRLFLAIFHTNMTAPAAPTQAASLSAAAASVAGPPSIALTPVPPSTPVLLKDEATSAVIVSTETLTPSQAAAPAVDTSPAPATTPVAPASFHPSGMTQMSAAQIKKEFNVPLSTRRIQQLLCKWRHQARKEKDKQHALMTSADALLTVAKSNATTVSGATTDTFTSSATATSGVMSMVNSSEPPIIMSTGPAPYEAKVEAAPSASFALAQKIESSVQQIGGDLFEHPMMSSAMESSLPLAAVPAPAQAPQQETPGKQPDMIVESQVV